MSNNRVGYKSLMDFWASMSKGQTDVFMVNGSPDEITVDKRAVLATWAIRPQDNMRVNMFVLVKGKSE